MTDEVNTINDLTDGALVRRFLADEGREEAFEELFRRYGALTYAFFHRRIGNPELAAEQNQDLYMSLITSIEGFRGDCSFRSWLFSMAHNRLMQVRRRLRIHTDESPEEISDRMWQQFTGSSGDAPEAHAVLQQQKRRLWRCMAGLSETERAVVYGQYYDDTTLRELTVALRLTNRSGARAELIKAQRKLRRCLESRGGRAWSRP